MSKKQFSVEIILIALFTAICYSLLNLKHSSITMFVSVIVGVTATISLLYFVLSFTKIKTIKKMVITGVFTPILLNIIYFISSGVSLLSIYPKAFLDSLIILGLLLGVTYIVKGDLKGDLK